MQNIKPLKIRENQVIIWFEFAQLQNNKLRVDIEKRPKRSWHVEVQNWCSSQKCHSYRNCCLIDSIDFESLNFKIASFSLATQNPKILDSNSKPLQKNLSFLVHRKSCWYFQRQARTKHWWSKDHTFYFHSDKTSFFSNLTLTCITISWWVPEIHTSLNTVLTLILFVDSLFSVRSESLNASGVSGNGSDRQLVLCVTVEFNFGHFSADLRSVFDRHSSRSCPFALELDIAVFFVWKKRSKKGFWNFADQRQLLTTAKTGTQKVSVYLRSTIPKHLLSLAPLKDEIKCQRNKTINSWYNLVTWLFPAEAVVNE